MRILVTEDNPKDREIISQYIKEISEDIIIDDAESLKEAKEYVNKENYDLIFLDLILTDSQGFETVTEMKKAIETSKTNQSVSVIILTGMNDYEIGKKALALGIKDFLMKDQIDSKTVGRTIHMSDYKKHLPKKKKMLNWI
tara:strand:+ start:3328 stop:3750 length:423 start_codon:yes stop_codon:yes gene_type:complete